MLEQISITDIPEWVKLAEVPPIENDDPYLDQFTEGYYTLLVDRQKNLTNELYGIFLRFVFQINDIQALNFFNSIQIGFFPPKEKLHLHHINIIRNNKVIQKLDLAKLSIFRREQDLEKNIITGEHTCHHIVSGLQVGDQIDYAYTWLWNEKEYANNGPKDIYYFRDKPIYLNNYRVLWPIDKQLYYKTTGDLPIGIQELGDFKEIHVFDPKPELSYYEGYSPISDSVSGILLSMSSFEDWSHIVNWGIKSYTPTEKISEGLTCYIAGLISNYLAPKDQIMQVLEFCSNEITYTYHNEGLPWNNPNNLNTIFERRYGDCKDKVYSYQF